jgi:hypothetical protein
MNIDMCVYKKNNIYKYFYMSELKQIEIIQYENTDNCEDQTIEIIPILENEECKICNLEKEILDKNELFQNEIDLLVKEIELLKMKLSNTENLLQEKNIHLNILQDELKNKEISLNNKTEKINNIELELEDVRYKNKQQNMVSLLTKLKTNEIKVPIIIQEDLETENTENINFPNKTKKDILLRRRKKIF